MRGLYKELDAFFLLCSCCARSFYFLQRQGWSSSFDGLASASSARWVFISTVHVVTRSYSLSPPVDYVPDTGSCSSGRRSCPIVVALSWCWLHNTKTRQGGGFVKRLDLGDELWWTTEEGFMLQISLVRNMNSTIVSISQVKADCTYVPSRPRSTSNRTCVAHLSHTVSAHHEMENRHHQRGRCGPIEEEYGT